jgi:formyl-CoA transferase
VESDLSKKNGPLTGIRVIDLGQLIAGPFAATLLGDFGAEVIKIELPEVGDNIRDLGPRYKDTPLWWAVVGRNKKSVTLDLRKKAGQEIFKKIVAISDVLIENYLPGTLEKWNLGPEVLKAINPRLVFIRVSGFGQTGPYKTRYGYDRIALAVGGLMYISGYPELPPVRPGIPWADYTAGLFSALAAMMALYHRDGKNTGQGQMADIALYECIFRLLDWDALDYDTSGVIRERQGNFYPASAPANTYITSDDQYVVIACTNDRVFKKLVKIMGREDLLDDLNFNTQMKRIENQKVIDKIVADWVKLFKQKDLLKMLIDGGVPASSIYNIKDIFEDPHYQARESIVAVDDPGMGKVHMQGIVPRLSLTPGSLNSIGPKLGEHNKEIYQDLLSLDSSELDQLRLEGVI